MNVPHIQFECEKYLQNIQWNIVDPVWHCYQFELYYVCHVSVFPPPFFYQHKTMYNLKQTTQQKVVCKLDEVPRSCVFGGMIIPSVLEGSTLKGLKRLMYDSQTQVSS